MLPSETPFPPHWWGIGLEEEGIIDRPDRATYGRYNFDHLPSLPFEMRGDFAWLANSADYEQNIRIERAAENASALSSLQSSAGRMNLPLPAPFKNFMANPAWHKRIRSNTDCFLSLCPEPIPSPIGDGYLVRFLADSQGCVFWYLYLAPNDGEHAVVSSTDFYGTKSEQWDDEPPNWENLVFAAESFEAFMCRFWIENEIWFSRDDKTPLPSFCETYIQAYNAKSS